MRAVLDTNVVISGLLWRAAPRQVLDAAREKRITLCTSGVLLDELAEVLSRPHLASAITAHGASPAFLMQRYAMLAQFVIPAQTARVVPKDLDDDAVIACALAAQADWIISGDAHLLNLKHHQGMRIIDPAEAIRLLAKQAM